MIIELRESIFGKNYDYLSLSKRSKSNELYCNWLKVSISKLRDEIAVVKNMVLQAQMIMVWGDLDKLLISLINLQSSIIRPKGIILVINCSTEGNPYIALTSRPKISIKPS